MYDANTKIMLDNLGIPVTRLNILRYLIRAYLFTGRRKFSMRYDYLQFSTYLHTT